ncbi:MAG: hypothetical protein HY287_08610 [Planctomycetes bacterium]|nr:hypothetical protein [Planctomycetota bacterium]
MLSQSLWACALACVIAPTDDPLALLTQARSAHQAKDYATCASRHDEAAKALPGAASPLFGAACCCSAQGDMDATFERLEQALDRGWHDIDRLKSSTDLEKVHRDPRWAHVIRRCEEASERFGRSCKSADLRGELLNRMREDQGVRLNPPAFWEFSKLAEWRRIDAENTAFMKVLIEKCGWPEKSHVGDDGALAVFLLVQHADDVLFQKKCLPLLTDAVDRGEARPQDRAYLLDRILVRENKPQRYGTQFQGVGADLKPFPIEDEANIDARRHELGLSPMAEYAKQVRESERR